MLGDSLPPRIKHPPPVVVGLVGGGAGQAVVVALGRQWWWRWAGSEYGLEMAVKRAACEIVLKW